MKNEKGFTLIEMMVVLLIISVLLIVTLPNITKSSGVIDEKGCEAFIELVESQAQLFKIENGSYPTDITALATEEYLGTENTSCPNGETVVINLDGSVTKGE
jgi:competence protein ComGC